MRFILPIILLLTLADASAQNSRDASTLYFCGTAIKVPPPCVAETPFQVKCNDFDMSWSTLDSTLMPSLPEKKVDEIYGNFRKLTKEPITCYLTGSPVKAYKISYEFKDGNKQYMIYAFGFVKKIAVIFTITLNKDPRSNNDLPPLARQIISLTN